MNWSRFHARLHQTLKSQQLLPQNSKILIAVSGGKDSMSLTKLMLDLQPKWDWEIAIAHCDHCWEADIGLADHVATVAENWGISFHLKTANIDIPETEAAARKWRYQVLIEIAENHDFNYIITGHTMSDRSETFLYNLVRGAGSNGLSALDWERNLTEKIKLIRPLLNFSRQETLQFCQQFNLPIWEDIYNTKKKYARNRIRLDLIPYLQENFNPKVETKLANTAELLKADTEYLEEQANKILPTIISDNKQAINRIKLGQYHIALQRRIIRQFLIENLKKHPNFEQIEAVRKLINSPNKSRTSTLTGNKFIEVKDSLILIKEIG